MTTSFLSEEQSAALRPAYDSYIQTHRPDLPSDWKIPAILAGGPLIKPASINTAGSVMGNRANPKVVIMPSHTQPKLKVDPRPWQKQDRNTPGQTNRVLEDRWDDESAIGTNQSTYKEIAWRSDHTVLPEALRRRYYLGWAGAGVAGLLLYLRFVA